MTITRVLVLLRAGSHPLTNVIEEELVAISNS